MQNTSAMQLLTFVYDVREFQFANTPHEFARIALTSRSLQTNRKRRLVWVSPRSKLRES